MPVALQRSMAMARRRGGRHGLASCRKGAGWTQAWRSQVITASPRCRSITTQLSRSIATQLKCSHADHDAGVAIRHKVVVIAGATGTGKSDMAIALARRVGGEVINCDSVQVYKGLNIGANKTKAPPDIPHHLFDLVSPQDTFNAAHYTKLCYEAIEAIVERGKVPILVGGSSMYSRWVMQGYTDMPMVPAESRATVSEWLKEDGGHWAKSAARVARLDPELMAQVAVNNWRRLKDILAHQHATGKSLLDHYANAVHYEPRIPLDIRGVFLSMPSVALKRLLDFRCEVMIAQGLVQEVLALRRAPTFDRGHHIWRSIGYAQALRFLDEIEQNGHVKAIEENDTSLVTFIDTFQNATRRYARKQMIESFRSNVMPWVQVPSYSDSVDPLAPWIEDGKPSLGLQDIQSRYFSTTLSEPLLDAIIRFYDMTVPSEQAFVPTRSCPHVRASTASLSSSRLVRPPFPHWILAMDEAAKAEKEKGNLIDSNRCYQSDMLFYRHRNHRLNLLRKIHECL